MKYEGRMFLTEAEYFDKWENKYNLEKSLIDEAFLRIEKSASDETRERKIQFVDMLLYKWKKNDVRNITDLEKYERDIRERLMKLAAV